MRRTGATERWSTAHATDLCPADAMNARPMNVGTTGGALLCAWLMACSGPAEREAAPHAPAATPTPVPQAAPRSVERAPRFEPSHDYVTDGYGDTVVWNAARPLTWADFRRPERDPAIPEWVVANTTLRIHCMPTRKGDAYAWDVRTVMKRDLSWVHPRAMGDSTLLTHERLHFDIGEVYARELRRHLAGYKGPWDSQGAQALIRIVQLYNDSVLIVGERYDRETEHHIRRSEQLRWQAEVARQLKGLDAFAR